MQSLCIGIGSSFIASVVFALIVLLLAARVRKSRAKPFIGTYEMANMYTEAPYGGSVTIEFNDCWWENLTGPVPVLTVSAKHGSGTEDWYGALEVLGLSDIASGFYRHSSREGGALRFILSKDKSQITEHGIPHDPQYQPFVRLLKRQEEKQKS